MMPVAAQVERAIRFSYAQMMFNAVFAASTGGMFLIGFAIQLGADNVLLGLMITLPQFFVVFQFLAAWLIERGISRRRLTIAFAFVTPLCWLLIATLPLLGANWGRGARFGMKTLVIGGAETGIEITQETSNWLIQDLAASLDEDLPDVQWTGEGGAFDGFWADSAVIFGTMLPLAMLGAAGGLSMESRNAAFRKTTALERTALGITPEAQAAITAMQQQMSQQQPSRGESA
jgi:hypothetical protein